MTRLAAFMLCVGSLASAGRTEAQAPHQEWWKYFKGQWTYEIGAGKVTGTVVWRMPAQGHALVGSWEDDDGTTTNELTGWRLDTKTVVTHGYGSKGNYFQYEFNKITPAALEGAGQGILPDGKAFIGTLTVKRVDDDHFEWQLKAKTPDGEDFVRLGKAARTEK